MEIVARFGDRVVDVRHLEGDRYVVGEGPEADLPVQLPPTVDRAGVPLVIALAHQAVLGLIPGMTGELTIDDQTHALADLVAQGRKSYALPPGARCEAALGELRFSIALVEPAAWTPARRPVDRLYWLSNAGSLLLIAAVLGLGSVHPPGELSLDEIDDARARAVRYISDIRSSEPPPPAPPRQPSPVAVPKARSSSPPAARPSAPPPEPAPLLAAPATGPASTIPRGEKRGVRPDNAFARSYGLAGDEAFNDSVASVTASLQEGMLRYEDGAEELAFWNGVARAPARARPFGGLELAETERGGGVHGERVRKPAGGGAAVTVSGKVPPKVYDPDKVAAARLVVRTEFDTPYVQGDMDAINLQKALRDQEGDLRRCYKQEIGGAEDRQGTVMFRLKIDAEGRVSSAHLDFNTSKLGDMRACLEKSARTWKFSPPLDRKPAQVAVQALLSGKQY